MRHERTNLTGTVIETDRLVLRGLAAGDEHDLANVAGAPSIAEMMITVPHPMTLPIAREWIARERAEMQRGSALVVAVRRRQDAALLGVASLRHLDHEHRCGELSFWLSETAQGNGYATEAARAVLEYGFAVLELNRIEAYHMVRNEASERVLRRLGFRFEATLRQRVIKLGVALDVRLWSRLRSDSAASDGRGEELHPGAATNVHGHRST